MGIICPLRKYQNKILDFKNKLCQLKAEFNIHKI